MKNIKHLIFYWYIPENKNWYWVYDLHIKNLTYYRSVFDKITFVISHNNCDRDYIDNFKKIFTIILGDKCEFVEFENDKEVRETKFFYEEIVQKMNLFDENEFIFFAHNKGVDSNYVTRENLQYWINIMYFSNLYNMRIIDDYFNQGCCAVGDIKIENYRENQFNFLTYGWMYSGTFFWISPYRISKYLKDKHIDLKEGYGRYYTEGFLGKIFSSDSKECVAIHRPKTVKETNDEFLNNTFNDFEKGMYNILYN